MDTGKEPSVANGEIDDTMLDVPYHTIPYIFAAVAHCPSHEFKVNRLAGNVTANTWILLEIIKITQP